MTLARAGGGRVRAPQSLARAAPGAAPCAQAGREARALSTASPPPSVAHCITICSTSTLAVALRISPPIPRHEQHPRHWRTPNTASGGSRKNARESALASDRGRPESPRCCAAPDPPLRLEVQRPRLHQPCLAWRGVQRGRGEASASCPCLDASSQDAPIAAVQRVGDPRLEDRAHGDAHH